jgi:hypothetical protein
VCIYFYMPQPVSTQLIHAAMLLARWSKIAGPGAFDLAGLSATASPWKGDATPAFSGVRPCPDLSAPQPPATEACAPAVSAQTLNTLRAQVLAEPGLRLDVFGILDAMAVRFEAAQKEMTIAQGRAWDNDMWDLAAKQVRMKKSKIEKWCRIVAAASSGEGRTRAADAANVLESSGETVDMSADKQWEIDLFDGIMLDMDLGVFLDTYGGWDTDAPG